MKSRDKTSVLTIHRCLLLDCHSNLFFLQNHDHTFRKRRKHFQPSKKLGCPSKVIISRVLKFPGYKVYVYHNDICGFTISYIC